jgi:hypothetical protein
MIEYYFSIKNNNQILLPFNYWLMTKIIHDKVYFNQNYGIKYFSRPISKMQ